MSKTILVVDDNRGVQRLIVDYLTENNFRVITAANGREALYSARTEKPDLILLDIMMPELDGYEFMRLHGRERDTPIILLTARIEESDKVFGLELGADDYVTKPFGMAELVARIRAVLRRVSKEPIESEVLRVNEVVLDKSTHLVTVRDHPVALTRSEFDLLSTFMSAPDHVFSRLDLLERLKGDALEGAERTIDVHIRNLRTKIEADPTEPRYILTVFGTGYRFVGDQK